MAKISYREIPAKLRAGEVFDGNSMKGRIAVKPFDVKIDGVEYTMIPGTFVIFSYTTVIAFRTPSGMKVVSETKFSQTTTRQQNLCAAWL